MSKYETSSVSRREAKYAHFGSDRFFGRPDNQPSWPRSTCSSPPTMQASPPATFAAREAERANPERAQIGGRWS
jgi:hypothetical protein